MNRFIMAVMFLFVMGFYMGFNASAFANNQDFFNSTQLHSSQGHSTQQSSTQQHSTQQHSTQQQCYAMAMLGKDTVINARLGLPPEHALRLTRESGHGGSSPNDKDNNETFDNTALNVMLAAYLWSGTPQAYAASVYRDCAKAK